MTQWKYMSGGPQYGPVDTEALAALLRSGTLKPDTQVMKEGGLNWAPANAFPEFASVSGAVGAPTGGVPPLAGGAEVPGASDVEKNKVFAVLAYIGLLFLVPLLAAPDSKFARYHTNQGVVLFITVIVVSIVGAILGFIPFLGCIIRLGLVAVWICLLVFMILGILNAANGRYKPLPLIGHFTILK